MINKNKKNSEAWTFAARSYDLKKLLKLIFDERASYDESIINPIITRQRLNKILEEAELSRSRRIKKSESEEKIKM